MITCEFENGKKANLRHTTVGVIIVNDLGEILLVKRAPNLSRPNTYTIPGGYVDQDETIAEAATRELQEETGYVGQVTKLFHVNDFPNRPNEDRQNIDFICIAEIKSGEKTLNKEVTEIKWFSLEKLPTEEEFAFDHRTAILKYFEYLRKPFMLPIIGNIR